MSGLSAWIVMTRSQFSLPLRIWFLEANQCPFLASGSLTDQPGLIFSGSDGSRRFRNSSTPLLLGSRSLTKIWEREILQGEEQGAACCSAGPPSKANSPHTAQTPHLFGLRRACSDLFFFFSGSGPEPAESAQLEAWLRCSLWGPGKPLLWDP